MEKCHQLVLLAKDHPEFGVPADELHRINFEKIGPSQRLVDFIDSLVEEKEGTTT